MSDSPVIIDFVNIICRGCGRKRVHHPDRPFRGTAELIEFMSNGLAAYTCNCHAPTCDIEAHIKGAELATEKRR